MPTTANQRPFYRPLYVWAALAALVMTSGCACASSSLGPKTPEELARDEREAQAIVAQVTAEEMTRFHSTESFLTYLSALRDVNRLRTRGEAREAVSESQAVPASAAPADSPGGGESITNNQVAGVDEGGIVKTHGDHLVVLRRGRLFSVHIGAHHTDASALTPVSMVDAYPPDAPGGWYDEMLVHGDTIVVVGFNYQVGGTELGLFDIDAEGQIARRRTHYLRSNDYYSSRNYASRLVGDKLVFYMPYFVGGMYGYGDAEHTLPGVRAEGAEDWSNVITATDIYRPIQPTSNPALHTVVTCELTGDFRCTAQGILGPPGRSFFVSRDAVYVWVGGEGPAAANETDDPRPTAAVYRLPFDGTEPGAVRVGGMPIDQFSFQERDEALNVLVRREGGGDWMWAPEVSAGELALVQLPLALFSDGVTQATAEAYTRLPGVEGYSLQNRFVGQHLLYGAGGGWHGAQQAARGQVVIHDVPRGATRVLALGHGVDRLEAMGADAVVVGSGGGSLHFSAVALEHVPRVAGHHALEGASQGETRSHGFFYRASDAHGGTLGLPIRGGNAAGWHQLVAGSAGVLFLDVRDRGFERLGVLGSRGGETDDGCRASCVDWYGNARPIFYRGRVFALLGYELVEGTIERTGIQEIRRTHMFTERGGIRSIPI